MENVFRTQSVWTLQQLTSKSKCNRLQKIRAAAATDTTQKAIGQINLSKNKKLKSVKITGKLRKAKIVISKKDEQKTCSETEKTTKKAGAKLIKR